MLIATMNFVIVDSRWLDFERYCKAEWNFPLFLSFSFLKKKRFELCIQLHYWLFLSAHDRT